MLNVFFCIVFTEVVPLALRLVAAEHSKPLCQHTVTGFQVKKIAHLNQRIAVFWVWVTPPPSPSPLTGVQFTGGLMSIAAPNPSHLACTNPSGFKGVCEHRINGSTLSEGSPPTHKFTNAMPGKDVIACHEPLLLTHSPGANPGGSISRTSYPFHPPPPFRTPHLILHPSIAPPHRTDLPA